MSAPALPPPAVTAQSLLTRETDVGRLARIAALATAVATPVQLLISAFALHQVVDWFDEFTSAKGRAVAPAFRLNPLLSLASNITSVVVLAALVVTLVWVHASATTAARLGIPARRNPGWAVAGFLIPVVNLWWPYQSVRDLFPPGHPDRHLVSRWWALYLGGSFTPIVAIGVAFASVPAGLALGVLAAALFVGAAVTLRQVITIAVDAHAELFGGARA